MAVIALKNTICLTSQCSSKNEKSLSKTVALLAMRNVHPHRPLQHAYLCKQGYPLEPDVIVKSQASITRCPLVYWLSLSGEMFGAQ
jgi:hypothetical protein